VQQENGLPWALRGCGFSLENVLAWTYNSKQFSPLGVENLSDEPEDYQVHRNLILKSQARIFFLCGPRAANAVRPRSLKTFVLELRGFRYNIFVTYFKPEACDEENVQETDNDDFASGRIPRSQWE
jgi:hypothetical protein